MKRIFYTLLIHCLLVAASSTAQVKNYYSISFANALHHEAYVEASFGNIQPGKVVVEIANSSPERFGSYNFIKNIYDLKITSSGGNALEYRRKGLDRWEIDKHNGSIKVTYKIFADNGIETFSQINKDFAIINHPATFAYIPTLANRPIEIYYNVNSNYNWKVANQLKPSKNKSNTFMAKNLAEFMDSPTLIGAVNTVKKTIESGSSDYNLVLSTISNSNVSYLEQLLDGISAVTDEQKEVFGGYPKFDRDTYTILYGADYDYGNVLEGHKNSLLYTVGQEVKREEATTLKNFAKAFFKSWNGARIQPNALNPFNYKKMPIVKEYWFTEGFAEYYALLTMCRSKTISHDRFLREIAYHLSDVKKSAAIDYFSAVEMSENAGFTEGQSKHANPQNAVNTFIPVEKHGAIIALVLDLSLRNKDLSLDSFMKLLWNKYGKISQAFSIENFYTSLVEYAGDSFAKDFFEDYVNGSKAFDTDKLLENFGVSTTPVEVPYIGAMVTFDKNDSAIISEYTSKNTPAYKAGLEKGDIVISVNNQSFSDLTQFNNAIAQFKIGKKVIVKYNRNGVENSTELKLDVNPNIILSSMLKIGSKTAEKKRLWLGEE